MKILVISNTPWSNTNSFGNTFSNLFDGMENVEIFNICCKGGCSNNKIVSKTFQMTSKSILKSIFHSKTIVGKTINNESAEPEIDDFSGGWFKKIVSRRLYCSIIIRDMIWKFGRWRDSKELDDFIDGIKPDVLYLPIYNPWYMCDLQQWATDKLRIPTVGHISDDLYNYPKGYLASPLHYFYQCVVRKKLRRLILNCAYLEVFADNMKEQYSRIFNKKCYLIGKGMNADQIKRSDAYLLKNKTIKLLYTGNLGNDRWKVLAEISNALEEISGEQKVDFEFDVYSGSILNSKCSKAFAKCKCLNFKGSVSSEKVKELQKDSDILIHVESFSKKGTASCIMSLSTKVIDYLATGKIVFAAGPEEVNSIMLLKNNNMAIVAEKPSEIKKKLVSVLDGTIDLERISANRYKYMIENRNIKNIQHEMKMRLESLL